MDEKAETEAMVESAGVAPHKTDGKGAKKAKGEPKAKTAKGKSAKPKAKAATAEDSGKAKRKPSPYMNFIKSKAEEWKQMTPEQKAAYQSAA